VFSGATMTFGATRLLYCAYGRAGELGLRTLVDQCGISPANVLCFTYDSDENRGLLDRLEQHAIRSSVAPMNCGGAYERIVDFSPDLIVSLHYRHRIPDTIVACAPRGGINLHPSLLPGYRGCFSAPWVLIHGERETGVTYHRLVEAFDAGPIVLQHRVPVHVGETAYDLFHRLIDIGVDWLPEAIRRAMNPAFCPEEQVGASSYFPRKVPFDGLIDPAWPLDTVERFIRAMTFPPKPGAQLVVDGKLEEVTSLEQYCDLLRRRTSGAT
jgi:methionyl-tRNA formyltransferase